jgi:predicted phosphodiesterase
MTTAAIYDIHGNISALEAVLNEIASNDVDEIVVGGDVLPGPLPRECLDLLRTLTPHAGFIHGNGDRAVLDILSGRTPSSVPPQALPLVEWCASQLDAGDEAWLASWPSTLTRTISGQKIMFCHATPRSDNEIFTRETSEQKLAPIFENADAQIFVCGHTHMQFDGRAGTKRIVNAGSVGMPFGDAGACWVLIGNDVALKLTDYDLHQAAERVRHSEYPQAEYFAENHIITRPAEETILAIYRNAELK